MLIPFLLIFLAGLPLAAAEPAEVLRRATLYQPDAPTPTALYHWQLTQPKPGHMTGRYLRPDGTTAATDETVLKDSAFVSYSYTRPNIDERARVERQGDKVVFTQTWRGKSRRNEEDYGPDFVTGPLVVPYLQKRWSALAQGQELSVRFGVLEQLRTFGFKFKKVQPPPDSLPDRVLVRMRASSFFIRMFVEPIFYEFSPDGQTLYRVTGRTLPVGVEDGKPQPVEVEMVFH